MPAIRIGTRRSALARVQTDEAIAAWRRLEPAAEFEIVELLTEGDVRADVPLDTVEGTGFFTSALERALLDHRIDVAVHSAKDLPVTSSPGLTIAALLPRADARDALCARGGVRLRALPAGARVGTSSPRRTAQLRALRDDLECLPLRGNVPTRLGRLARGELDAIVLACAGLDRLGLRDRITEVFAIEHMLPAPAQGALAVQTRAEDGWRGRMSALDHAATRRAVETERAVLHTLRGGCSVPLGAYARVDGARIVVDAAVFAPDGGRALHARAEGGDPRSTGEAAAQGLLARGAAELLEDVGRARPAPEPLP
ncbi:MAG TPA: hydroxymethylbilane synthase [Candidatus Eisenbacteria bacterium]|nr:hydroxymethylbilane synthase [Candidatus Eisenbacteria bacterium]